MNKLVVEQKEEINQVFKKSATNAMEKKYQLIAIKTSKLKFFKNIISNTS